MSITKVIINGEEWIRKEKCECSLKLCGRQQAIAMGIEACSLSNCPCKCHLLNKPEEKKRAEIDLEYSNHQLRGDFCKPEEPKPECEPKEPEKDYRDAYYGKPIDPAKAEELYFF